MLQKQPVNKNVDLCHWAFSKKHVKRHGAFGAVAIYTGRNDVPGLCFSAFRHRFKMIPCCCLVVAIYALAVCFLKKLPLPAYWDGFDATLSTMGVLSSFKTIAFVGGVAESAFFVVVLLADAALDIGRWEPITANTTPRLALESHCSHVGFVERCEHGRTQ